MVACIPGESLCVVQVVLPGKVCHTCAGHNLGPLLSMPQNLGLQQQPMLPQLQPSGPQLGQFSTAGAGPSVPRDPSVPHMPGALYQGNPLGSDPSSMLGPYGPYYGH